MSSNVKMVRIPPYIGEEPLVGRYYMAECERCGWLGSSSELTDDCQCTREEDGGICLGHTLEVEPEQLFEIIKAMAKQATLQHQGDPVALPARKHPVRADYSQDILAEGWNACLNEIAKMGPLYTRADPGEVEQLRAKAEDLRQALTRARKAHASSQGILQDHIETLSAQLAERDALLAEIAKRHWSGVDFDLPADLAAQIKALPASAEPEVKS